MKQQGFANTTDVSPEKTRAEIETTLKKYKATSFISGWEDLRAMVGFQLNDRLIRFKIDLPDRRDREYTHDAKGYKRSDQQAEKGYDQALRTIWRRLLLCIKAKLESVASGIETFDSAFSAHILIPGTNQTVGEFYGPQIEAAYRNREMPKCLPGYVGTDDDPKILPHPNTGTGQ